MASNVAKLGGDEIDPWSAPKRGNVSKDDRSWLGWFRGRISGVVCGWEGMGCLKHSKTLRMTKQSAEELPSGSRVITFDVVIPQDDVVPTSRI